jgi:glycosyltransferase involved in cell wall biosynthesis
VRVCIDISPALHPGAGIGRYARELTASLLKLGRNNNYLGFYNQTSETLHEDPLFHELPHLRLIVPNKPWRLMALTSQGSHVSLDRLFPHVDLFHGTDNLMPYFSRIKTVFTLHDLSFRFFPETLTTLNRLFLSLAMPLFLKNADAVISVSENSKKDAVRLYGIPQEKITVVHLAARGLFHQPCDPESLSLIRRRYGLPEQYFLYVGTLEPRKNLSVLLDAFRQAALPEHKLVMAGKKGWLYESIFTKLKNLNLEEKVIFTGLTRDEDLRALYGGATAFLFPSLYEGFGIPVLEAMASGTPVICSNTSSLPEVAGNAALTLSPTDIRGWKEAMEGIARNGSLRLDLIGRGLLRAREFTWDRVAEETAAVYEEVHGRRR